MEVGGVTEQVNITEAELLETRTASKGQVIDSAKAGVPGKPSRFDRFWQ